MSDDTTFRLDLDGGFMQYNHHHDKWSVWSRQDGKLAVIDANFYKTIKAFKQWGQEKINERLL